MDHGNIIMRCWELNMNLSILAHGFASHGWIPKAHITNPHCSIMLCKIFPTYNHANMCYLQHDAMQHLFIIQITLSPSWHVSVASYQLFSLYKEMVQTKTLLQKSWIISSRAKLQTCPGMDWVKWVPNSSQSKSIERRMEVPSAIYELQSKNQGVDLNGHIL